MTSVIPLQKKIGILGGGQLARMLVLEGHKMGLNMYVLSQSASDPAALVTPNWQMGDVHNPIHVKNFLKLVDVATIESEFLSEKVLAEARNLLSVEIHPSTNLIAEFSDRLKQKKWFEKFNIQTSAFAELHEKSDVYGFIANTRKKSRQSMVFKRRHYGYDGHGIHIINDKRELESWLNKNKSQLHNYIVEDKINFHRELAIQIAINAKKEVCIFPLVEWRAKNSRCLWVKGPVYHKDLSSMLKRIIHALKESNYVGLAAFEFFDTTHGLLVNEMAPRVHNSGHYSLEGTIPNQFSAHLQAILNMSLPKAPMLTAPGFAMLNIIDCSTKMPVIDSPGKVAFHWYGKAENRIGRKMGHLTALAPTPEKALLKVLKVRRTLTRNFTSG
ncbi:MAG: hypothetical protein A2Z20_08460 [Bdellovibrionales bacterium RBG_16_40_8]|nr:MAG: hypothetical protein A2Z20_08460 [Bdellovibrionales bacterium RBG_16_40_8]